MHRNIFPLSSVPENKDVEMVSVQGGRGLQLRLASMGLNIGVKFKILRSVKKGPCVILIGNTRLVLGFGMASRVLVRILR